MPRPILKRGASPPALEADVFPFAESSLRHVAFPVSKAELEREHAVHSPRTYDRSPIVVDRRYSCAMPERGCRFVDEYKPTMNTLTPCPDLCSSSSESDESSDGFASPPPEPWDYSVISSRYQSFPEPDISTTPTQDRPLSFLPYPNPHVPHPDEYPTTPTRRSLCRSKDSAKRAQTPKPKATRKSAPSTTSLCRTLRGLGFKDDNDDGCLGGF